MAPTSLVFITRYVRQHAGFEFVSSTIDAKASLIKMEFALYLEFTICVVFSIMNDCGLLSVMVKTVQAHCP